MSNYKYLVAWVLAAVGVPGAKAQPPDAGQPRAGQPLTPEQEAEFQRAREEKWQKRIEEEQATERLVATKMIAQFAGAIRDGDLALAARSIEGEHDWSTLTRLGKALQHAWPRDATRFELLPLFGREPENVDEFEAHVATLLKRDDPLGLDDKRLDDKTTSIEKLTLRRGADRQWKIVLRPAPPATPESQGTTMQAQLADFEARVKVAQGEDDGFLNAWARALAQPRPLLEGNAARASLRNTKQLLLGILQLSQDFDEKLAFTPADFQQKVMPYVKSKALFQAPVLDEAEPFAYTLNPAIAGQPLAKFAEIARTVAVYEADKDGKPLFRFEGKAVIGFVDGHAKLTTPEEAAQLIWKP